jgi:CubicO group peptidase (beta-lactamase class C family)
LLLNDDRPVQATGLFAGENTMSLRWTGILFITLSVCQWTVVAEDIRRDVSAAQVEAIDAAVRQQMETQSLVGVAVGWIHDGRLVFTKGYGLASRTPEVSVTSDTVFNWASNSKPLAAMLAMQLVESGRLDLDKDIRTWVPEFPQKAHPITVRQLLSHQSGIPHYSNGRVIPREGFRHSDRDHDPVIAIGRFCNSPLIFEPGEKYSYSSYAYVLLSAVVQRAAAQPFESLTLEQIARPLQMQSLQWDVPENGQQHWARGYVRGPLNFVIPSPEQAHFWKHGAGGLKSNIVDFGKWAEALVNRRLLQPRTWQKFLTIPATRDGSTPTMALGINVSGSERALKLWHSGSQGEARSRLVAYPNQRHGMVVLTNSSHADTADITTAVYAAIQSVSDN